MDKYMFFHGLIEILDNKFDYLGNIGDYCQVTAYLPEDKVFAVVGKNSQWITLNWSETQFLTSFGYIPPEKCYNIEGLYNFDY